MPIHRRAKSDSDLYLSISAPVTSIHLPDAFRDCHTELYPAQLSPVQQTKCLQFKPHHAEYYQRLLAECENYAGLITESGLGEPILPTKSGGITHSLPSLVGHRTQTHYLHAIRLILSLRQDLHLQSQAKAFWKGKANEFDPNLDAVTPSASDSNLLGNLERSELQAHTHESTSTLRQSAYIARDSVRHSQLLCQLNRLSVISDSTESFYTVAEDPVVSREASSSQLSPIPEADEDSTPFDTSTSLSSLTASLERICAIFDTSAEFTLVNDISRFSSSKSLASSEEYQASEGTDFSWEAEEVESPTTPEFPSHDFLSLDEPLSPRPSTPFPFTQKDDFASLPCSTPPKKNFLQISDVFGRVRSVSGSPIKPLHFPRRN